MFTRICVGGIYLVLMLSGCEEYEYKIEMRPRGEQLERQLVISDNVPRVIRDQIAKWYPHCEEPNIFTGTFAGKLPEDVGGAGTYNSFRTELGSLNIYAERFRGNTDQEGCWEQIRKSIDKLVDLLTGWLEAELGEDKKFENLRQFCDTNLRKDIKNLSLYHWTMQVVEKYKTEKDEGDIGHEFLMRAGEYLWEKGYFEPEQLGQISAIFDDDSEVIMEILRELIAKKMGYASAGAMGEKLNFVADEKSLKRSLDDYLEGTEYYQRFVEKQKEENESDDPNALEPTGSDALGYLLGEILGVTVLPDHDKIEVGLLCETKPLSTNGKWDEDTGKVSWSASILRGSNREWPVFCYAIWSFPNEDGQRELLGEVALSGGELAEYCLWRKNLSKKRGKEWDDFILSLAGCESMPEKLKTFRFSNATAEQEEKPDEPVKGSELILGAVTND